VTERGAAEHDGSPAVVDHPIREIGMTAGDQFEAERGLQASTLSTNQALTLARRFLHGGSGP